MTAARCSRAATTRAAAGSSCPRRAALRRSAALTGGDSDVAVAKDGTRLRRRPQRRRHHRVPLHRQGQDLPAPGLHQRQRRPRVARRRRARTARTSTWSGTRWRPARCSPSRSHDKGKTFGRRSCSTATRRPSRRARTTARRSAASHRRRTAGSTSATARRGSRPPTRPTASRRSAPSRSAVRDPESGLWTDHLVNAGADDANFGNFWMATPSTAAATSTPSTAATRTRASRCTCGCSSRKDHGVTWTAPYAVDNALPGRRPARTCSAGSPAAARASPSSAGTTRPPPTRTPTASTGGWPVAQVRGLDTATPQRLRASPATTRCTTGRSARSALFCGILPGSSDDRSLLDFFKVDVAAGRHAGRRLERQQPHRRRRADRRRLRQAVRGSQRLEDRARSLAAWTARGRALPTASGPTRCGGCSRCTGRCSSRRRRSRCSRTACSGRWSLVRCCCASPAAGPPSAPSRPDQVLRLAVASVLLACNWGALHLRREQRAGRRDLARLLHQPARHRRARRRSSSVSGCGRCSGSPIGFAVAAVAVLDGRERPPAVDRPRAGLLLRHLRAAEEAGGRRRARVAEQSRPRSLGPLAVVYLLGAGRRRHRHVHRPRARPRAAAAVVRGRHRRAAAAVRRRGDPRPAGDAGGAAVPRAHPAAARAAWWSRHEPFGAARLVGLRPRLAGAGGVHRRPRAAPPARYGWSRADPSRRPAVGAHDAAPRRSGAAARRGAARRPSSSRRSRAPGGASSSVAAATSSSPTRASTRWCWSAAAASTPTATARRAGRRGLGRPRRAAPSPTGTSGSRPCPASPARSVRRRSRTSGPTARRWPPSVVSVRVLDRRTGEVWTCPPRTAGSPTGTAGSRREPGRWVVLAGALRLARGTASAPSGTPSWRGRSGVELGRPAPPAEVREAVLRAAPRQGDGARPGRPRQRQRRARSSPTRWCRRPPGGSAELARRRWRQGERCLAHRAGRLRQGLGRRRGRAVQQARAGAGQPRRCDDGRAARRGARPSGTGSGPGSALPSCPNPWWSATTETTHSPSDREPQHEPARQHGEGPP